MWPHSVIIVLLVFYNLLVIRGECPADRHKNDNYEVELLNDLFCSYDTDFRPVQDHNQTVNVEVKLVITYISFDQTEEIFTVRSRLQMTWRDEFLKWDPFNYGGIKEIQVSSYRIWVPRMALFNSDASASSDAFYTLCLVKHNGTVICDPHEPRSGLCRTWLRNWPYDKQKCTLYFGSWMHSGEQINFTFPTKNAITFENYEDVPGWKLFNTSHVRLPGKYHCCPNESFPLLKYIFQLERKAREIEAIVVVPSIVLVIITTVTLLLDVKEDLRLALQCYSLFGHLIFLDIVAYYLPKQNMDTPIILLFIRDSMVMSLASIVLTLVLTPLRERADAPPSWLMKLTRLVASGPGKYVVFTGFEPPNINDRSTLTEPDANEGQLNDASIWLTLANALNSIVFVIYVVVYISLLCIYIPEE